MRTELRPLALEFPSGQGFAWRQEWDSHWCQCSKAGSSTRNHGALSEGTFPHPCFFFLMWWITMNWINYRKNCKTRSWNRCWHEIGSWLQLSGTSTRRNLGSTLSDTSNASSPCCLPPPSLCCSAYKACSPLSQWPWLPSVPCPLQLSWCYRLFFLETFESCLRIQHRFASMALTTEGKKKNNQKPSGYSFCFYESFPPCFKPRVLLMNLSE